MLGQPTFESTSHEWREINQAANDIEYNIKNICGPGIDVWRFRRSIDRILIATDREKRPATIATLQTLTRLLLFAALHHYANIVPHHFFTEDAVDDEYRSAFTYYNQSENPERVFLAGLVYHEYTADFNLNSDRLKRQVAFLEKALNGNINRIVAIVEQLFTDTSERALIEKIYELLIRPGEASNDREVATFQHQLERVEMALAIPTHRERAQFELLCNTGYPIPLAAIATYCTDIDMPRAIYDRLEKQVDVLTIKEVFWEIKAILSRVYCCERSALNNHHEDSGNFWSTEWGTVGCQIADEVPHLLEKLATIEKCCTEYQTPEVAAYLHKLISSVPGFVHAYLHDNKPSTGNVTSRLQDYTNRNLGDIKRGNQALEVIMTLFPSAPERKSNPNAWWAFEAVMACDETRFGENYPDATTGKAALDFLQIADSSEDPEAAIRHYFNLRSAQQDHEAAIICLGCSYPKFATDMESSRDYIQWLWDDPELATDKRIINDYHNLHAIRGRLASVWQGDIPDPVLKARLTEIEKLPYTLGSEQEAFSVDTKEDLLALHSWYSSTNQYHRNTTFQDDITTYFNFETVCQRLAKSDSPLIQKILKNYQAALLKRFRHAAPLFPISLAADIVKIYGYIENHTDCTSKTIREYAKTTAIVATLQSEEANYPFIKDTRERYNTKTKKVFASDKEPVFPLDLTDDVVTVWEYTEALKTAELIKPCPTPSTATAKLTIVRADHSFIDKLLHTMQDWEMYRRHGANMAVINQYAQNLGGINEEAIRTYPQIWNKMEEMQPYREACPLIGNALKKCNDRIEHAFGKFPQPLFPFHLVEEVVELWRYAQLCERSNLDSEPKFVQPDLTSVKNVRTKFPFIAHLLRKTRSIDLCLRNRGVWSIVWSGGNGEIAKVADPTITLSESEKIMLAIVNGHIDRAALEWLRLQRFEAVGLLPMGAKTHTLFSLDAKLIEIINRTLQIKKTERFRLIHNDDCLLYPPGTVIDFQLRAMALMKLGIFAENEGDMQFTSAGRLSVDAIEGAYLASLMLLTTPVHVTYAPGAFATTHEEDTGRRILITDPLFNGVKQTGLPFDLPQAIGRVDMLGMRDIKQSPHHWQLWSTLIAHEVFKGDERLRSLYKVAKNEYEKILDKVTFKDKKLSAVIRSTAWIHRPQTKINEGEIKIHEQMVSEVCQARKEAMDKPDLGVVGECRALYDELRKSVRKLQPIIAKEKPEETARLLAGL